ncbi:MAG: GntR family transcriptional regulator [Rhodospirillaceae bacterium]|jgi:GntR family transcriptional regulator, trigonelline degradation regulator|nr:GntR family transcriptional regulator [Rhodospirillaceae bacterium]MBT5458389.1 GntR family transcriptional regulator [Rhodospirillaceae bacterium]
MSPANTLAARPNADTASSLRVRREVQSLRMMTVDTLRRALLRMYFQPGDRLIERELCELTGVSRTSVREALRHLESEGLIENVPHRGPSVARLNRQDALDLFEVRSALEPMTARLFVERASDGDLRAIERAIQQYQTAAATQDTEGMMENIADVYDQLFDGCGNATAAKIIRTLHVRVAFSRAITYRHQTEADVRKLVTNSKKLLRALKKRDADAAAEASLERVTISKNIAIKILDD